MTAQAVEPGARSPVAIAACAYALDPAARDALTFYARAVLVFLVPLVDRTGTLVGVNVDRLAERLGIGRVRLRHALDELERAQLVRRQRASGTTPGRLELLDPYAARRRRPDVGVSA